MITNRAMDAIRTTVITLLILETKLEPLMVAAKNRVMMPTPTSLVYSPMTGNTMEA